MNIFLALIAGTILPLQIGINGSLRAALGQPILAAFTSFFVGTCALGAVSLLLRATPAVGLATVPAWMWLGGALGAVYVYLSIFLTSKLAAATLVGCIVAGQLSASMIVDHFGWLGFPQHSISIGRIAGAILLGLGVYCIRRF